MKNLILASCFFIISGFAMANKASVTITTASSTVKKGTEITITLNVDHQGNSKMHHVEWVYLKINGKEIKRWIYDKSSLPENQTFKLTYKFIVNENVTIEAEANCNIHGSKGIATQKVSINEY